MFEVKYLCSLEYKNNCNYMQRTMSQNLSYVEVVDIYNNIFV